MLIARSGFRFALAALLFGFILIRSAIERHAVPSLEATAVGAVLNFFDTLGIGSFAPTTAWLKFRKLVPDRLIPPTMLVGLTRRRWPRASSS